MVESLINYIACFTTAPEIGAAYRWTAPKEFTLVYLQWKATRWVFELCWESHTVASSGAITNVGPIPYLGTKAEHIKNTSCE